MLLFNTLFTSSVMPYCYVAADWQQKGHPAHDKTNVIYEISVSFSGNLKVSF